jgi:Fic-DOC domain mobile mystery protein B
VSGWEPLPGETPLDLSGLKNRGPIKSRRDLAAAEALNINRVFMKYLAARPSSRSAPFDYEWFLKLHEEMFGEVWTWAGEVRRHDVNIGVPHFQITESLSALASNLHGWAEFGHTLETQATWLHHKSVQIHPFENGNGRWARLLASIWLKQHGEPIVAWPDTLLGEASEIRGEYLSAIRAADGGNYAPLYELHQRFAEG